MLSCTCYHLQFVYVGNHHADTPTYSHAYIDTYENGSAIPTTKPLSSKKHLLQFICQEISSPPGFPNLDNDTIICSVTQAQAL